MLDFSHIPTENGASDIQTFIGKSDGITAGVMWETWVKPRGKSMCSILLIGNGANGGTGVVGANSVSAGGGGGGSGAMTSITIPINLIPDQLYISLNSGSNAASSLANYVSIAPPLTAGGGAPIANNTLVIAGGGGRGGNAVTSVGGTAGAAGAIATLATMPLGWQWANIALAGQAGIAGGAAIAGAALTLPLTGLIVTGGTGGAGLGAAAAAGTAGGAITGAGVFPTIAGGLGTAVATTPPGNGNPGCKPFQNLGYWMGGTGGGSTHGTATTTGLVQSSGGDGAIGCGGGGMGGALTGSAVGAVGKGGPAYCQIICW
jgi:hypothetical protein